MDDNMKEDHSSPFFFVHNVTQHGDKYEAKHIHVSELKQGTGTKERQSKSIFFVIYDSRG